MVGFDDPKNEGNSPKYHTGKPCIEPGCERPAGTSWSHLWCFECNVERIRRIDKQMNAMLRDVKAKDGE